MPKASAPNAPCVEVWLSPQTIVMPGQGQALLGPDDVDDALADVVMRVIGDAELAALALERLDLDAALGIRDAVAAVGRRHVVVGDGERRVGAAHLAAGHAQALEGLRARHLVDEMAVDVEEARRRRLAPRGRHGRPRSCRRACAASPSLASHLDVLVSFIPCRGGSETRPCRMPALPTSRRPARFAAAASGAASAASVPSPPFSVMRAVLPVRPRR